MVKKIELIQNLLEGNYSYIYEQCQMIKEDYDDDVKWKNLVSYSKDFIMNSSFYQKALIECREGENEIPKDEKSSIMEKCKTVTRTLKFEFFKE